MEFSLKEFGKRIFEHIDQHRAAENADSIRLQPEEAAIQKMDGKGQM